MSSRHNPRKTTAETLSQADGVLAVFVGVFEHGADKTTWRPAAIKAMQIADDLKVDDLTVHVDKAQTIRVVHDGDHDIIAVVTPYGHPIAKSLPRSMRRVLQNVRDERKKAHAWSDVKEHLS